jgi:hypothetical protein
MSLVERTGRTGSFEGYESNPETYYDYIFSKTLKEENQTYIKLSQQQMTISLPSFCML